MYSIFRKYIPQGIKVLDWGVGNGHFSYFLVHAGYKAFGFSLENFPMGVELGNIPYRFVQGGVRGPIHLPFRDCSFSAIAAVGVLEHVYQTGGNEAASLGEIARVLKPNGMLVCYHLPNRYSLIEALARRFPQKHHHPYRYTTNTIITLVKRAKLQLVEMKRYGFLPRNIWQYAPTCMRHSKRLAQIWDVFDMVFGYPFTVVCQNYIFVACKPGRRNSM